MIRTELARKNVDNPEINAYVAAVKRAQKNTHVVPTASGWAVRQASAARASRLFDDKPAAISFAKTVAKKGSELIVHKKNGRIQARKLV